ALVGQSDARPAGCPPGGKPPNRRNPTRSIRESYGEGRAGWEPNCEMNPMSAANTHNLPEDLRGIQLETEAHARDYGLDFFDTIFEVLDYDEISEIAALGGFPNRYPHWRFGMEYQQLSKGYRYGLQKIYEMVINNDPCYAYLLRCNQM